MLRLSYPPVSQPLAKKLIASRLLSAVAALALPLGIAAAARAQATTAPADTAAAPAAAAPAPAPDVMPPAPAPEEASPEEKVLRNDVWAYFHYAWIGKYDLASQMALKITDEATDPKALIPILQDVAKEHDANQGYLAQLLLFDNQPDAKAATDKLLLKVQAGNVSRAQDPDLIAQTLRDMNANERAYENHLPYLRASGEMAVPVMLQFMRLNDDSHLPYRSVVRRALADMGRDAVNPLIAATEMRDTDTLLTVIDTLASIGYDAAGPYLAALATDASLPEGVHAAAKSALGRLGADAMATDPAGAYLDLATKFYYGKADIAQVISNPGPTADAPILTSNYWVWDAQKGLVRTEVPAAIFYDLMAQRTLDSALKLKADMPEAVALWLDANNKREVDLPVGSTDPIRGDQPSAHYYNVSVGAKHLNDALARALKDRNSAVALKLTHSLGQIVGRVSLDVRLGDPLTEALRFSDKRVRFEAALAIGTALPAKPFSNQDLVVPLLVQAIGEGGGGNIIVIGPTMDDANALANDLKKLGYVTAAVASPGEAVPAAATLPSVDAIVIARGVSDPDITAIAAVAAQTPALADTVQIALKAANTGTASALALSSPTFSVTTETTGDGLKKAIEDTRTKAGQSALDPKEVDAYALAAADALEKLAVSQNAQLSVAGAEPGLLAALDSPRAELVAAIGKVVAYLPTATAQQGLAKVALNDQAAAEVRISLFKSLSNSAKAFGNQLEPAQVSLLQKQAVEIKEPALRSGAAEALGALNLPTDQARDLILNQIAQ